MKKISLIFIGEGATFYTPAVPETGKYQNRNTNPVGSHYAQTYGRGMATALSKAVRAIIYDAAPQQYMDLKILGLKTPQIRNSDEIFYSEIGFGRDPIIIGSTGGGIAGGATQTIPVVNLQAVSPDMIVVYPDIIGGGRGTVTSINSGAGTIVVSAETNNVLPALPAAASGVLTLANLAPVEADGANSISQYYRIDTLERVNYIQMLAKAQRWGRMEYEKYSRAGTLSNYLAMQRKRLQDQFRTDLSNVYWNGRMAEVTLSNDQKAKTAGGIFPIMQQAGSAHASCAVANLPQTVEELALDTEYGVWGKRRFLYGAPRAIHYLSQQYKRNLTRYAPNDMIANLGLEMIKMGSTEIVFVPVKRFEEASCFPTSWRSRMLLIDQEAIQPVYFFPEEAGQTLARTNNGTLQNYTDYWMTATFSIEYSNPLGGGYIDITDLP